MWLLGSAALADQGLADVGASSTVNGLLGLGTVAGWLLLGLAATIAASFWWERMRLRPTAEDARLLFGDD